MKNFFLLAVGTVVLGHFFINPDPDFLPIGIRNQEKKSDPDPDKRTRIQTKEPGSETLVKIISTWLYSHLWQSFSTRDSSSLSFSIRLMMYRMIVLQLHDR